MSLKVRIGLVTLLIFIFTAVTTAQETEPIKPLPSTAFRKIELPEVSVLTVPSYPPTPTPSPRPTKAPPRPQKTSKPKVVTKIPNIRVSGTVSVKMGARIAKAYARERMNARQFDCLNELWRHESGWRWNAHNRSSGAYGIPQALPGSKMASKGRDWRTNPITQVRWGLGYISGRYGTPCEAWRYFQNRGWY